MAHLTQAQIEELGIMYKMLAESATAKGLNADLCISMYNSPITDDTFDAVSIRVEKHHDEEVPHFWENIVDAATSGWEYICKAFDAANQFIDEWEV